MVLLLLALSALFSWVYGRYNPLGWKWFPSSAFRLGTVVGYLTVVLAVGPLISGLFAGYRVEIVIDLLATVFFGFVLGRYMASDEYRSAAGK